jgi:hypothetical protein
MHGESINPSLPPLLIYFGMGLATARFLLDKTNLRGLTRLEWLQFLVRAASIVFLWPLVLFLEKMETWLHSDSEGLPNDHP